MTVSRVLAVCGLTATLPWSAFGQPQPPSKADPAVPAASASRSDETTLLKQMEGRWKVDVSIDPDLWNPHLFKDDARSDDAGKPAAKPSDSRDPSGRSPDSTRTEDLGKSITGYSSVRLILGDRVLQETTVLPDMKARMDRGAQPDDKNARPSGKTAGEETFKGVSLFSFDEKDKTYSMVFVDNCQGGMHYCTGSYDAGSNRLVFNSVDHGTARDASAPRSPADRAKWQGLSGMQVVVEFVSPDEHRVTMYANATPMSGNPGRVPPTTGKPGDHNNPDGSPSNRDASPSTDRTTRPGDPAPGKVVYRAVYHRASGADLEKVRDALRISDATEK